MSIPKPSEDTGPLFARVFDSDDGQRVLTHLRRMTLDQVMGPHITDAHLRHMEGQRFIVTYILNQIKKGQKQ